MNVVSLGFQTDLMVRRLAGSVITDREKYLVVRTPANPVYWWGNFLLFRRPSEAREVCGRGYGAWFGAFTGDRMRSGCGVFTDGSGVVRFQNVETDPAYRRRGLASHAVYEAGRYALYRLGGQTLVIAADPQGTAIRIYRSLGFAGTERQVQLQRPPRQF